MAKLGLEMSFDCKMLGVVLVIVLIEEMKLFNILLVEFLQFFEFSFSINLHSSNSLDIRSILNAVTIVDTLTNNKITTFYCSE
jgi:hypothetical protein